MNALCAGVTRLLTAPLCLFFSLPLRPDTAIVYAKTRPEGGAHGITAFLVEKGMPVRCAVGCCCAATLSLDERPAS